MDNETMQYIVNVLESAKQHLLQSEQSSNFTSVLAIAKINHALDVITEVMNEYVTENDVQESIDISNNADYFISMTKENE